MSQLTLFTHFTHSPWISRREMTHYFDYLKTFWLYPNQRNLRPNRNEVSNLTNVLKNNSQME